MSNVKMDTIRSIDRAVKIIDAFSIENPTLTIEEIVEITNIPKSTTYRILHTLCTQGLVQFDKETFHYKPGLRLIEFGFIASSTLEIRKEAKDILDNLQTKTNQTVLMAIPENNEIFYIYVKEKYAGLKFSSNVGQRRPFTYGILGPTLLAFLQSRDRERILDMSATEKQKIIKRLDSIRENGYYIEANETNIGVTGIGAPIFGINKKVIAAIGVIGSSIEFENKLDEFKKLTLETSYEISLKMGYK